jgi:hypothetical protein
LNEDRALRLFRGAGGIVEHLGEYEYVRHTEQTIRATRGPGQRKVFVFTFRPISA